MGYANPDTPVFFQVKEFEDVIEMSFTDIEHLKTSIQVSLQNYKKELEVTKKELLNKKKKKFFFKNF